VVDQSEGDISDCKVLRQPNFGQNRLKSHTIGVNFSYM